MYLLALSCLLDFGFGQLFKVSQHRGFAAPVVVSVNYLVIALVLGVIMVPAGQLETGPEIVRIGVFIGIAFICSMSMMTWALGAAHVAVVLVAFRLSLVVPIAVSLAVWGEAVDPFQWVGLGLAVLGLCLITAAGTHRGHVRGPALLGVVLAVFLLQGTSHSCMRAIKHAGLEGSADELSVLFVVALTAGGLGALRVLLAGVRPRGPEVLMGVGIGLFNLVALVTIIKTLAVFKSIVFFPVVGCTLVILDSLAAHYGWKEPLPRRAWIGVVVAVIAIVMVLGVK